MKIRIWRTSDTFVKAGLARLSEQTPVDGSYNEADKYYIDITTLEQLFELAACEGELIIGHTCRSPYWYEGSGPDPESEPFIEIYDEHRE